jgi:hypothetical protein
VSSGAGSAFGEIFSRNGSRPSEVWRRYQAGTSSVCGQDASITSPIDSVWRRVACRQVHNPKAMLAVPAPWPAVFFDGIVRRRARASIALPLPPPNVRLTEARPACITESPHAPSRDSRAHCARTPESSINLVRRLTRLYDSPRARPVRSRADPAGAGAELSRIVRLLSGRTPILAAG